MWTRREVLGWAAAAAAGPAVGGCAPESRGAVAAVPEGVAPGWVAPAALAPDPAIGVRRAGERGIIDHGWLKARHTFAFASYRDAAWERFRHLRVINEDTISPGGGFPMHPHRDMEILTYVLEGALEHKDSLGNGGVIRPGEVQYMSAGRGVRHSEFNPAGDASVHLLQIWLLPDASGAAPRYESRHFGEERHGELRLVASRDGREGSFQIRQAVDLYAAVLRSGQEVLHGVEAGRAVWMQVARGGVEVNGHVLSAGDGAFSLEATGLEVRATEDAEVLLFDMG